MTSTKQTVTSETTTLSQVGIDWNNTSRWVVTTGLGEIPEVGGLVSALVGVLWPENTVSVWDQIKNQVQALIKQEISTLVYSQVQNNLAGLKNNMTDYLNAIQNNAGGSVISQKWNVANGNFEQYLPNFQSSGYELLLLPLFAQFANLHLSLLRDGVLFGSSWGWNDGAVHLAYQQLTNNSTGNIGITPYTTYANQTYQKGLQNIANSTPANLHLNQPFLATNAYTRGMTLIAMDYVTLWQYFDTKKYPKPISVYLDREIYSDPQGTSDGSTNPNPIAIPSAPTQPLNQITVSVNQVVRAVQVAYPAGGGPDGETQTPMMGYGGGESNQINVTSSNPIKVGAGRSGDIVYGLMFYFKDGTETAMLGGLGAGPNGDFKGGTPFYYFYSDHILSSVYVHGGSEFYQCADCVVFGFKLEQSQPPSFDRLRLLYITSPTSVSLNNLATRNQSKVDPKQLTQVAATENWDAHRRKYWKHMRTASQAHQ